MTGSSFLGILQNSASVQQVRLDVDEACLRLTRTVRKHKDVSTKYKRFGHDLFPRNLMSGVCALTEQQRREGNMVESVWQRDGDQITLRTVLTCRIIFFCSPLRIRRYTA